MCMAIGNAFVLQTDSIRHQVKEQQKVKQYFDDYRLLRSESDTA